MALVVVTWDLPTTPQQMNVYNHDTKGLTKRTLAAVGTVSWQAFRNPRQTSPQVMALQEMDSLESAQQWAQSAELVEIIMAMRGFGCSNFQVNVWDNSPLNPTPLRP